MRGRWGRACTGCGHEGREESTLHRSGLGLVPMYQDAL